MKKNLLRLVMVVFALMVVVFMPQCKGKTNGKDKGTVPASPTEKPTLVPAVTAPPPPHVKDTMLSSFFHGNQVSFGSYEQDGNESNGKEPIIWTVNETWMSNNKIIIMLVSNKTLFVSQYNEKNEDVTWASCSLRKYLNNEFVEETFTVDEQTFLFSHEMTTLPNPNMEESSAGITTKDRVFVPDYGDYNEFGEVIDERGPLTAAAKKASENYENYIENSWWLRTPGQTGYYALTHNNDQRVVYEDGDSVDCYCGVRPAVWIVISTEDVKN